MFVPAISDARNGGSSTPLLDVNSGGEAAIIVALPAERPIHHEKRIGLPCYSEVTVQMSTQGRILTKRHC
jgi:hypothetical protein